MRKGQQREEFGQNAVSRFWLASHLPDKSRKEKKIKLAICDGREQLSYLAATLKLLMPLITTQRLVRLYEVVVYAFHYRYARPPNCFAPQAFAHSNSQPRKSRVYDSSAIECCQNGFFCGKGQVGACWGGTTCHRHRYDPIDSSGLRQIGFHFSVIDFLSVVLGLCFRAPPVSPS